MLKNISNLGKALSKHELKSINGGGFSQVDCHQAYNECDACHPNDHSAFSSCMQDLGCGGSSTEQ